MSWDNPLPAPIPVPGAKPLVTLRDAAMLIQELPKAQADQAVWQTAIKALMLAAEERGPLALYRRIGFVLKTTVKAIWLEVVIHAFRRLSP